MALLRDVWLPTAKFSNFDLSRKNRFTASPGRLYPVLVEELLPGDTVHLSVDNMVKTYPLLSPLYGSFQQQVALFFIPTRLYTQAMDINRIEFSPQTVLFPTFRMPKVISAEAPEERGLGVVQPSSILDLLGVSAGVADVVLTSSAQSRNLNATPIIGYYDIFRNYYANTQEPKCYMSSNVTSSMQYTGFTQMDLSAFDSFIDYFIKNDAADVSAAISASGIGDFLMYSTRARCGGLMLRTHRPDFYTAWLSQGVYDQMVTRANLNVENNTLTINQIRFGSHLMEYFERGLVAGGRYDDWVEAQFGIRTSKTLCIPELLGVATSSIVFDEVVSTSNTTRDAGSANEDGLGDLAGRGVGYLNSRKFRFTSSENGYLMAIYSIVPNVDYSSGVRPLYDKLSYMELYSPAMQRIGFQPLMAKWLDSTPGLTNVSGTMVYSYNSSSANVNSAIGYQPAWTEYMTAVNEVHGDFNNKLGGLSYWAISRRFNYQPGTIPTTYFYSSYVIPTQFTYPFTNQAPASENFLIQMSFDFKCRRPIGKAIMPTLA